MVRSKELLAGGPGWVFSAMSWGWWQIADKKMAAFALPVWWVAAGAPRWVQTGSGWVQTRCLLGQGSSFPGPHPKDRR